MTPLAVVALVGSAIVPAAPAPWKFAVIGDTQLQYKVFKRAAADIRRRKPEFVVHLGDVASCGAKVLWNRARKLMKSTRVPWKMVIGNHELYYCYKRKGWYSKRRWVKYWYGGNGTTYRYFQHKGRTFVLLDTSTRWLPWKQNAQVRRALGLKKPTFVFAHRPLPYPRNRKFTYNKGAHYFWYRWLFPAHYAGAGKSLWKLLHRNRKQISHVFHGHYHALRRYKLSGIPITCTGGGGGGLESRREFHHYLMVTVTGSKFSIQVVKL
jgi:predicted phosphodiesterase